MIRINELYPGNGQKIAHAELSNRGYVTPFKKMFPDSWTLEKFNEKDYF
jgi:hypothetical protein